MPNLRIAPQCACPTARHIRQHQIEGSLFRQRSRVRLPAFNAIAVMSNTFAQLGEPLLACLAGNNTRLRVTLGEDEGFASGGCARVKDRVDCDPASLPGKFRHQLRAFILDAYAPLTKRRSRSHISGDNDARRSQHFAGFKMYSRPRQFLLHSRPSNANRQPRLNLPVPTNRVCCLKPVEINPSLHHPARMAFCQRQSGSALLQKIRARSAGAEFAEYRVHHARRKFMPCLFGQLNALINRSPRGNAIQMQQLERTQPQRNQNLPIEFGVRPFQ